MSTAFTKTINKEKRKTLTQTHAFCSIRGTLPPSFSKSTNMRKKGSNRIIPLKWCIMGWKEKFLSATGKLNVQLKYTMTGSTVGKTINLLNLVVSQINLKTMLKHTFPSLFLNSELFFASLSTLFMVIWTKKINRIFYSLIKKKSQVLKLKVNLANL